MRNDDEVHGWSNMPEPKVDREVVLTLATILSAKYHPQEGFLIVQVKLQDGSRRSMPIHKSTFGYYHGVRYVDAPKVLVDREMFKTEALFNTAAKKNRRVRIKLFKEQMELDGLSFT